MVIKTNTAWVLMDNKCVPNKTTNSFSLTHKEHFLSGGGVIILSYCLLLLPHNTNY